MAVSRIIARGIGFGPGTLKFIVTGGFGSEAVLAITGTIDASIGPFDANAVASVVLPDGDTGWLTAFSADNIANGNDGEWQDVVNATTDDLTVASRVADYSNVYPLRGSSFGAALPPGSTVNGIQFRAKLRTPAADFLRVRNVRPVKGGFPGTVDVVGETDLDNQTTLAHTVFGGLTEKWGENWTAEDINKPTFGFQFDAYFGTGVECAVVQARVLFSEPGSPPPVSLVDGATEAFGHSTTAHMGLEPIYPDGIGPFQILLEQGGFPVYLVEITAFQGGATVIEEYYGHGTHPTMALGLENESIGGEYVFKLSDRGYISRADDTIGVVLYEGLVRIPLSYERAMPITPEAGSRVAASWGEIDIANPRDEHGVGRWDNVVKTFAIDGRRIRVLLGSKRFDSTRGIYVDPPYSDFGVVFSGIATGWRLEGDAVRVSLRDGLAAVERPLQTIFYTGSGNLDGPAELTGKPKPKTRGVVRNIEPVLVDPTARIYQVSDMHAVVTQVYERGAPVFTNQGDVSDLYANLPSSGSFKTDSARGLFRLGANPVGLITCDVEGHCVDGLHITPGAIAQRLLIEGGIDPTFVEAGSFEGIDGVVGFESGIFCGLDPVTTLEKVDELFRGIGASIGNTRTGFISAFRLVPPIETPVLTITEQEIVEVMERQMPLSVDPPNYRRSVGYTKNHSVQISDIAGSATLDRRQFLAQEYRTAAWFSGEVAIKHLHAVDAAPILSALDNQADAQVMADFFGSLWGIRRSLYDVRLRLQGFAVDVMQPILVRYPLSDLSEGKLCVIVGERVDASRNEIILTVFT